jgi:hypothetical protein
MEKKNWEKKKGSDASFQCARANGEGANVLFVRTR